MSPLAESAAAYLNHQPALNAAVVRLDAHLVRCDAVLHPAAKAADPARATRRRVEAGLRNHQPVVPRRPDTVPRGKIYCKLIELPAKARAAKETVEARYNANN